MIKSSTTETVTAAALPTEPGAAAIKGTPETAATAQSDGEPHPVATETAVAGANGAAPPMQRDEHPPQQGGIVRDGVAERSASPPTAPRPAAPLPPRQPVPTGQTNGDHRRTLHLSLGAAPTGNGSAPSADPGAAERPTPSPRPHAAESAAMPFRGRDSAEPLAFPDLHPAGNGEPPRQPAQPIPQPNGENAHRRNGGAAFIDHELRARVAGDIQAFLGAFDAALAQDTQESRSALREATDRLLRAGARTSIELERLEARVPLPARDGGRSEPAWRHR